MTQRLSAGILAGFMVASLAACTTSARRTTTAVGPTPTPAPLIWARHELPAFSPTAYTGPSLELSASDPHVAYLCVISQDGQAGTNLHVWRTDDQAAHWTEIVNHPMVNVNYPVVNPGKDTSFKRPVECHVVADLFDPSTAAIVAFEQEVRPKPGTPYSEEDYTSWLSITHDAGETWQTLSPPPYFVQQAAALGAFGFGYDVRRLATVRGKTYAMFSNFYTPQYLEYATIAVSTDGMRTWASAEPPASHLFGMWVNRATGELLVASEQKVDLNNYGVDTLWASSDGQAPWRIVKDFTGQIAQVFLVTTPMARESWRICYSSRRSPYGNATAPVTPEIDCSADSGATWRRAGPFEWGLLVLAHDGSLYDIGNNGGCDVLRLRPDAATWESVGMLPVTDPCHADISEIYTGESGHVVLWNMPIVGYGTPTLSYPAVYTAEYA